MSAYKSAHNKSVALISGFVRIERKGRPKLLEKIYKPRNFGFDFLAFEVSASFKQKIGSKT